MKNIVGTAQGEVEATEVLTVSGDKAISISVSLDEKSFQSTSVSLTRDAAIRLYHQLNNILFSR